MNDEAEKTPADAQWARTCEKMLEAAQRRLREATTTQEVDRVRVEYLGRKGALAKQIGRIPRLPQEERPAAGRALNELKRKLTKLTGAAASAVSREAEEAPIRLDPTLPPQPLPHGHIHPISRTIEDMVDIFRTLGFEVVEGPEVELDWYNFEALNMPADHPSREDFHTFFLSDNVVLRSHTSPAQVRTMQQRQPPLRIIVPGRVFRPDTEDARHFSMFHQVEGLMVGEGVGFGDLKAVLHIFLRQFFRQDVALRFEPDFFPFTEPSAQVHCTCAICGGKGCRTCSYTGWLELLGAGMVDPNVFEAVGYDTERYTGFAFGVGMERVAMLRYGIDDIRLFLENDLRFLKQF